MDRKKAKEIEALLADHERWDSRELGASEEYLAFVSDKEQKEIEEGLGLQMISLRLSKTLIEEFKELAKIAGIGYQPLMRRVLTQYAKQHEHELTTLLSPERAAQLADKLFAQAVKLKGEISSLAPLSNERVLAERDYSTALSQAQMLFAQAAGKSKDVVLKQHSKRRIEQIVDLCQKDSQESGGTKYGKRKQAV